MTKFKLRLNGRGLAVLLALVFCSSELPAGDYLKCSGIFSDNMVLQRNKPVPIWGWSTPGTTVTVTFAGQSKIAVAGDSGRWEVRLANMGASSEPRVLSVSAGESKLILKNVLVGEVWVASGQSNMKWPLSKSSMPKDELANLDRPMIRILNPKGRTSSLPVTNLSESWTVLNPETAPHASAVASYFAMKLQDELNIPVGIFCAAWDASHIEPWTPAVGYDQVPELEKFATKARSMMPSPEALGEHLDAVRAWVIDTEDALKMGRTPAAMPLLHRFSSGRKTPAAMYHGMIHPLTGYAIRGAIWYQGESNIGYQEKYGNSLRALIAGWRAGFNQPELPFYFVQLPPFSYRMGVGPFWEAQFNVCRTVKNTGMAVTTDIGELKNLHPSNKKDVGHRLALWALAKDYGKDIAYSGPLYKGFEIKENSIVISFDHADSGLSFKGKEITEVYIKGEGDTNFVKASPTIEGSKLVVIHPEGKPPLHVRMGWEVNAVPNLINKDGLPASPFRTDK